MTASLETSAVPVGAGEPAKRPAQAIEKLQELTIIGLLDEKPMMIWASHYLSAMAKALLDDAELGMKS
ncbi:DUF3077 domain-containing protein [Pseudomonas sp. NPDC089996]|uniref:DUF3077 domain-containing protein n=1 Tax=Pseudomonas sp. NPDC089996 TaxID=3364474 RepID=UPI00381BE4A5